MLRQKLRSAWLFGLTAVVAMAAFWLSLAYSADKALERQCQRVTVAMSESEVIELMGQPHTIERNGERPNLRELVYQRRDPYASGPIVVQLESGEISNSANALETYRVIRTTCEDIW